MQTDLEYTSVSRVGDRRYTPAMTYLLAGITLWSAVHCFPMALPGQRSELIERFGKGPYKGAFSLLIIAAVALIVIGWREAPIVAAYLPPLFGNAWTTFAVGIAVTLLLASQLPTNIKRFVRHPQLTGVFIWAVAHLLVNGTARDLILFGGLGLWAVFSIVLSNRRDGAWRRPPPAALWKDAVVLGLGAGVSALLFYFHGELFGVSPLH